MGGCVVSIMDRKNSGALVSSREATAYRQREGRGNFLRAVPNTETDNASAVFRSSEYDDKAYAEITSSYDGPSFYTALHTGVSRRGSQVVVGFRPVETVKRVSMQDAVTGKTKTMEVTHLKPTVQLTYAQLWDKIECFGLGLRALDIPARSNIAIYQDTCVEWLVSIYGIWSQDMVAATVYANLGEAALGYALHETSSDAIVCSGSNVSNLVRLISNGVIPSVPIIYVDQVPAKVDTQGVDLYSFEKILQLGEASKQEGKIAGTGPKAADDLAVIMYTSGTTGDPKGVMHTHGSLACGAACLNTRVKELLGPPRTGETYCAYLPMAHIMEFTIVNILISRGAYIGFGTPRTLTDATARPHGDLREYRPHFVVGVPRIFDTIKKTVEAQLPPPGSLKRKVFDHAYQSRLAALKAGKETPYWNEKVFGATRAALGGRATVMLAGGGPISAATQEFANVALGPCVAGYGMTETVCVGGIQLTGDYETSTVGLIEPGEEIKLLDTDVYTHKDKPEIRGELLTRGKFLFKGYYKQPQQTSEAIDEDGWFHTGDVASLTPGGKMRIVGRVKALAKNSLGEYIALEVLEAVYGVNPLIMPNSVCVLVHPNRSYITAIALTDEAKATAFAKHHNIKGEYPHILRDTAFQRAAAASLAQTAKDAQRKPFECVRHVRILNDEWTPENDTLTAALKLKRRVIDVQYAETITQLFTEE